ncbi:hypothetical protein ACFQ0M_34990 [Kitasatospora aburaviensis]
MHPHPGSGRPIGTGAAPTPPPAAASSTAGVTSQSVDVTAASVTP